MLPRFRPVQHPCALAYAKAYAEARRDLDALDWRHQREHATLRRELDALRAELDELRELRAATLARQHAEANSPNSTKCGAPWLSGIQPSRCTDMTSMRRRSRTPGSKRR